MNANGNYYMMLMLTLILYRLTARLSANKKFRLRTVLHTRTDATSLDYYCAIHTATVLPETIPAPSQTGASRKQ